MSFPEEIFNGCHLGRKSMSYESAPTFSDYTALSRELEATQTYLKTLGDLVGDAPSLDKKVKAFQSQLANIIKDIKNVTLPEDISARVLSLEQRADQLSKVVYSSKVSDELAKVILQVKKIQIVVDQLSGTFDTDVQAFQKNVKGWMKAFSASMDAKVEELKQEIVGAIDKLGI